MSLYDKEEKQEPSVETNARVKDSIQVLYEGTQKGGKEHWE